MNKLVGFLIVVAFVFATVPAMAAVNLPFTLFYGADDCFCCDGPAAGSAGLSSNRTAHFDVVGFADTFMYLGGLPTSGFCSLKAAVRNSSCYDACDGFSPIWFVAGIEPGGFLDGDFFECNNSSCAVRSPNDDKTAFNITPNSVGFFGSRIAKGTILTEVFFDLFNFCCDTSSHSADLLGATITVQKNAFSPPVVLPVVIGPGTGPGFCTDGCF